MSDVPLTTHNSQPKYNAQQIHEYFSPYKRISPPWDLYERVRTILVAIFILPFRILYLILSGALLLLVSAIAVAGWHKEKPKSISEASSSDDENLEQFENGQKLYSALPWWRKQVLGLMFPIVRSMLFVSFGVYHIKQDTQDFKCTKPQQEDSSSEKGFVIVANHLGYIDILVLMCKFRGSFVAKGAIESTPFVGVIAKALQCMFVRSGQSLTSQLITRVKDTYVCHMRRKKCPGCPTCMMKLVIFPEGTTTNGTGMVAFRTGVFNAGVPVKPVCIRFPYKHFNLSWETIRFREHLFRTMTQFKNNVHITELPVYEPNEEEKNNSGVYASNVQREMAEVLQQQILPLNRDHKFLYHSYLIGKEPSAEKIFQKADQLFSKDERLQQVVQQKACEQV